MKFYCLFLLCLSVTVVAQEPPMFSEIEKRLKKLDLTKIVLGDLLAAEITPMMLRGTSKDTYLPNPFLKKGKVTAHLWASYCGPCLVNLQKNWRSPSDVWVNVDNTPGGIARAREWLQSNGVKPVAYYDIDHFIEPQVGGFVLPATITALNGSVIDVYFGAETAKRITE